jgi:hypothetical protein
MGNYKLKIKIISFRLINKKKYYFLGFNVRSPEKWIFTAGGDGNLYHKTLIKLLVNFIIMQNIFIRIH